MPSTIWLFVGFTGLVLVLLAIDLGLFHRKAHVVSLREAAIWSAVWIALGLLFYLFVHKWMGVDKGLQYITAYVIEKSLSVDNIFVFLVIFSYFNVPAQYQHRVLFFGILGAIVMRGIFIATGLTLLNLFHWVIYLFGAFLIFTGIKLALRKEEGVHPERNPILRLARRFFPVTTSYHGQSFFVRQGGRWLATPLFLVLLAVESTDLVFAVDSVPAVLAISRDPFIAWTSNVMAILGLRALFFLLAGVLRYFRYLKVGLSGVLAYIGVKMLISDFYHMPTAISLGIVMGILAVSMLASHVATVREARAKALAGSSPASSLNPSHAEPEATARDRGEAQ